MTKIFGLARLDRRSPSSPSSGIARGQDTETLVLLCISTAISAIPTGLPTFVQTMLSSGAQHLAEAKAVVKSLTDVETLGGTTVINSDKTGTLTMNAMTATTMLAGGEWFKIEGGGYAKTGAILGVAGGAVPDFTPPRPRAGAVQRRDRRRRRVGHRRSRPRRRSSCSPRRWASTPRRPARRCRAGPRCRSTPSTSSWRRSTTAPSGSTGGVLQRAALHDRQGCARRRHRALQPRALARRAGADRRGPRRAPRRQPAAVRARACACSRSRPATSTTRAMDRRARRPDGARSPTSSWSRWSGSSTRCAPRRRTRSASRSTPASTCA